MNDNRRKYLGIVLIVLVAVNLRPAITSVGPLLEQIQDDLGLSSTAAGALTTLPLLFFGSFGLLAPFLRRVPRGETLLVVSMALLVVALLVRVLPTTWALFAGSLLAGIGISVGNIAVPSIIKRDHPDSVVLVTAIYTVAISVGASVSSGLAVPVEHALDHGWRLPLVLLVIPAVVGGLVWLPRARRGEAAQPAHGSHQVWRSPLAWQVTLFMGLQSLLAYVVIGWLPTITHGRGLGESSAGFALALSALVQVPGALAVPAIERRLRDQRPIVGLVVVLSAIGFAGVFWAPIGSIWLWVIVLGLGQGLAFSLALSFIGLRSADARIAGQLSGMAQGTGYVIAALGPLAIGALHDASHGWTAPAIAIFVVLAAVAIPGLGAGRARIITAPEPQTAPVPAGR